jgi:hypothetical protein
MNDKTILLVKDNSSDIGLTKRALEKSHASNPLIVVEDGQAAPGYGPIFRIPTGLSWP